METGEHYIKSQYSDKFLLKLYHSSVDPGIRAYRKHHHTEFEISLFHSGNGVYKVGEKIYGYRKGDIFAFSSDEEHSITEIHTGEKLDIINIHFEPRFIWSSGNDLFDISFLNIFFKRNGNFQNRLDRDNPATKYIGELIYKIEEEFMTGLSQYEHMIKVYLLTILVSMIRDYDYVKVDDSEYNYVNCHDTIKRLETVMYYIDDNLESNISLDTLAKEAQMSRTYFSTIFKRFNGITPWEYITIKRVEKSIELLKTTDMTKLDIACRCGFNNTANFYRAFRKVTGKIPNDYTASQ